MNRLLQWFYHLLAKWSWIGCLLLIPSIGWGASTDSHIIFPASGASGYVLDNAALEQSGNSYFAIGVRYQKSTINDVTVGQYLFGKIALNPVQLTHLLYINSSNQPGFRIDKDTGGFVTTTIESGITPTATEIVSVVGQAFFNLPTNSGVTMWVNGNIVAPVSNSAVNGLSNGTQQLIIGGDSTLNTRNLNGKIYQAWVAFSDVPIITASGATTWHNNPTQLPCAGASRWYVWGPTGARMWPSGKWAESGVSPGKTEGQFDMSFNNHPAYRLWTPLTLWKWAIDKLGHWRQGAIP